MGDITPPIARFAVETPGSDLPDSARRMMALSLFDWFCVAIAGTQEPVSRIIRDLVRSEGGSAEASVFGESGRFPVRSAALANGATSHALDYDDTHFVYIGHPSVAVIPAALAVAQKTDASGLSFLDASLVGAETACRIGQWLGRGHYRAGFHQTATAGCFGAAAACARLLGLDATRTGHALGIATTRASGLKSQFGTMGKPYNAGLAAANGVESVLLAARGFVSRPSGLECEQGFADTHAGEQAPSQGVLEGLGRSFVFESVQHKFHACCHGLHAALESLVSVRDEYSPEPGDIESVRISVNPKWMDVCNIHAPQTGLEAKFSYRLTAAMVLCGLDTASLDSYSESVCRKPQLTAVRDKVVVMPDAAQADTQADVTVSLRSGQHFGRSHDLEAPVALSVRTARIREKGRTLLGESAAEAVWSAIGELERSSARQFIHSSLEICDHV